MDVEERVTILETQMARLESIDSKLDQIIIERAKEKGFITGIVVAGSAIAGVIGFGIELLLRKFGL